jgi:hypothetical protein
MAVKMPNTTQTGGRPEDVNEYHRVKNLELLEDVNIVVIIV